MIRAGALPGGEAAKLRCADRVTAGRSTLGLLDGKRQAAQAKDPASAVKLWVAARARACGDCHVRGLPATGLPWT
jgi:hypothetical protein